MASNTVVLNLLVFLKLFNKINDILGLFTNFTSLAFANKSMYGKSAMIVRAPTWL